jgi:hypothetical protein
MEDAGEDERIPRLPYALLAGEADRPRLPVPVALDGRIYLCPNCCPPVEEDRTEAAPIEEAELGRSNMGLGWRPLPLACMLNAPVLPPCKALLVSLLEDEAVPSIYDFAFAVPEPPRMAGDNVRLP